jgi:hypothetical protein
LLCRGIIGSHIHRLHAAGQRNTRIINKLLGILAYYL